MSEQGILIAGGYGVVGQRIAAALASDYPVIVAGRHLEQAKETAAAIGHGVRGRELDVTVEASIAAALQGVAAVMSCIDQPRRGLFTPPLSQVCGTRTSRRNWWRSGGSNSGPPPSTKVSNAAAIDSRDSDVRRDLGRKRRCP